MNMTEGEPCPQCLDPFDDHAMIATTGDPMDGGIILCLVVLCRCFDTWLPSHPDLAETAPFVPSPEEIDIMRFSLQSPELFEAALTQFRREEA